ncbi:MAG: family acetyltransferase [Cyanobacteria bacterium RYN_339]|nr:family acetyltransferase [Cyanobacteria bacterium RYN_339]
MIQRLLLDPNTVHAVLALQLAAYRVEARLLGVEDLPPMLDRPEDLLACGETFLAETTPDAALAGILSYTVANHAVEICRLMVEPARFRRGTAGRLFAALESQVPGWQGMRVTTGSGNEPALAFYRGRGFEPVASRPVREGLRLVTLERRPQVLP